MKFFYGAITVDTFTLIVDSKKMKIITCHVNADFDSLASMIAAQKLYPDAVMAFPGSQEKNVRRFISETLQYHYSFAKAKDIDLATLEIGRASCRARVEVRG